MDTDRLSKILNDTFNDCYCDADMTIDALRNMHSLGTITENDYDLIIKHWDNLIKPLEWHERCSDCYALVEGEHGEWICDECERPCKDLECCPCK